MKLCLLYQPRIPAAGDLARQVQGWAKDRGHNVSLGSLWDDDHIHLTAGTDVVVAFGGDGSLLRATHLAAPLGVPVLGVNFGRVGFLTEVAPGAVPERLWEVLEGPHRIEERFLLQAAILDGERPWINLQAERPVVQQPLLALNEVFVGRGAIGRLITLDVRVDGTQVEVYRADGLIASTPTGSTAYALAAGGPVVSPALDAITLVAVAAQNEPLRSLVIPGGCTLDVTVTADHDPVLSNDGLLDVALRSGDTVRVSRSPFVARFLRSPDSPGFYDRLADRLR